MAKNILNGSAVPLMTIMAVIVFIAAPVIWAVRAEGKIEVNKVNIKHIAEDIRQINVKLGLIVEKL